MLVEAIAADWRESQDFAEVLDERVDAKHIRQVDNVSSDGGAPSSLDLRCSLCARQTVPTTPGGAN